MKTQKTCHNCTNFNKKSNWCSEWKIAVTEGSPGGYEACEEYRRNKEPRKRKKIGASTYKRDVSSLLSPLEAPQQHGGVSLPKGVLPPVIEPSDPTKFGQRDSKAESPSAVATLSTLPTKIGAEVSDFPEVTSTEAPPENGAGDANTGKASDEDHRVQIPPSPTKKLASGLLMANKPKKKKRKMKKPSKAKPNYDPYCDFCDKKATHIQVPDPYAQEIHNDEALHNICKECYENHTGTYNG